VLVLSCGYKVAKRVPLPDENQRFFPDRWSMCRASPRMGWAEANYMDAQGLVKDPSYSRISARTENEKSASIWDNQELPAAR
jgi:hypothetical protein